MKPNEFYDVRTRERVTVNEKDITVNIIDASKYKDGNPRYQAVALRQDTGKKLYKFVSKEFASKYL